MEIIMGLLDYIKDKAGQAYDWYKEQDTPASAYLRGDDVGEAYDRALDRNISLLQTPEGAMDLVSPLGKVGGLLGTVGKASLLKPKVTPKMLDEFNLLAKEGSLRQARTSSQELKDLKSGKTDFAELYLNPDIPKDATKIGRLEKEGFTIDEFWKYGKPEDGIIAFKNKEAMDKYKKAYEQFSNYSFGSLYGYPEKDIAHFYSKFRSPEEFYADKYLWLGL